MSHLSHYKTVLKMAIPLTGARFLGIFTYFFALLILAQLGTQALAAGALIGAIQLTLVYFAMAVLFGLGPIISKQFGANHCEEIGAFVRIGAILAIILCLPVMIIFFFIKPILLALNEPLYIANIAHHYLPIYALGLPAYFLQVVGQMWVNGVSRPRVTIYTGIGSMICFIPLTLGFGLGWFGFPKWGAFGIGFALMLQCWIGFLLMLYFVTRPYFRQFFCWRATLPQWPAKLKLILQIGWPIAIQLGGELFAIMLLTFAVSFMSGDDLAARQISARYGSLIMIPLIGIGQGGAILVGQSWGRKDAIQAREVGNVTWIIALITTALISLLTWCFSDAIIDAFVDVHDPANQPIIHLAHWLLIIFIIGQWFDSTRNVLTSCLRGFYDSAYPMWVGVIFLWGVSVPTALVLGFIVQWGVIGIAIGTSIGIAIAMALIVKRWQVKSAQVVANMTTS